MVAQSVPNSNITPSHLSVDNSSKNVADGSFDKLLTTAQNKLEKTSWSEIEKLFNFSQLKFDFHLLPTKKEKDLSVEKEQIPERSIETTKNKEKASVTEGKFELDNTEKLKEVLTKNIPSSHIVFSGLYAGNIPTENVMLSKTDLQLVINDIIKQAKLVKSGQRTELSLSLANRELGKMFINLIMKNGQVAINISAESGTKKFLEDNLLELELALEQSDIGVDSIKISEVTHGKSKQLPN